MTEKPADNVLLKRVSRAMFWNASMLPVITVVNLAAAVMIRRGFGLQSGMYDVAIGVLNTLLTYSEFGLPATVHQFVPGLERTTGRWPVTRFVRRVAWLRFSVLLVALVPFNLFATQLANGLHLGASGVLLLHVVSVLAIFRAGSDIAIDVLQALLAHLLANLVQLAQAIVLAGTVAYTLWVGGSVSMVFSRLAAAAFVVTCGSATLARRQLRALPNPPATPTTTTDVEWRQFWGFALFIYVFEASNYFATPAFASPALAAASGGMGMVALFNVAFQIPFMVVVVILSGFQGLYRPLFAGVISERSPERLRTAFSEVSKVQAILLIPAGVGLLLMLPDYITLLFTNQFVNAAPLARLLCVFIFIEAQFNLGRILLAVDHRYTSSFIAQGIRIVGALVFVALALRGYLFLATAAFGAGRLAAAGLGFLGARQIYGVRFPLAFAGRVCLSSVAMGVVVGVGRLLLPSTWPVVGLLTLVGVVLAILGMRWFRVLGPREIDLLRRARVPGGDFILKWFPDPAQEPPA